MKIRIKGNSIRYRLTKTEVAELAEKGRVEESTQFGPDLFFRYVLEASETTDGLEAKFEGNTIYLRLPLADAAAWPEEERIGFQRDQYVLPDVSLRLLVEKDFVCLDDTDEDQSDNYDNPKAGLAC